MRHSGDLPAYRGSTTLYYSWLLEGKCSVSAIAMSGRIDGGGILLKRDFPLPPPDLDPDYYDCMIRAETLGSVLDQIRAGEDLRPSDNSVAAGRDFYVIHPLLKHIARLSRRTIR